MSERTKLLKKAVLTGVGATTNGERIKSALQDAMQDLVKIGQELMEELEDKGKVKTKSAQDFVKNFRDEASKRSNNLEKKVSGKVQESMQRAARDFGLVTHEDLEEIIERLEKLERNSSGGSSGSTAAKKTPGRKKQS